MIIIPTDKPLVVLGDTHSVRSLRQAIEYLHPRTDNGANIFHLGDTGFSFDAEAFPKQIDYINKVLTDTQSRLFSIRGNHDLRQWFDGTQRDLIHLLPDYSTLQYKDHTILAVGGSVSIDREDRLTENKPYDPLEMTDPIPGDLAELRGKIDFVLAHDVPEVFFEEVRHSIAPFSSYIDSEPDLKRDTEANRKMMSRIFELIEPKTWYSGHYHHRARANIGNCHFKTFGIEELQIIQTLP